MPVTTHLIAITVTTNITAIAPAMGTGTAMAMALATAIGLITAIDLVTVVGQVTATNPGTMVHPEALAEEFPADPVEVIPKTQAFHPEEWAGELLMKLPDPVKLGKDLAIQRQYRSVAWSINHHRRVSRGGIVHHPG